jgi:DinB family protein
MHVPQSIAAMPRFLEEALEAAGATALGRRGPGGTFSLREQACHLRDLEREGYLVRVRRILAEESPVLEHFDGDAVARARDYPAQDARAAARDFATARADLVALLEPLDARAAAREARFGGQRITLAELVAMIEAHDRGHREEIAALATMQEA